MSAAPSFVVDAIVPEETQGAMLAEAPATLGSSLDSFQHVEAIMKEDDVSTLGLDSQDWEMVSEMVADTKSSQCLPPFLTPFPSPGNPNQVLTHRPPS